MVKKHSKLKMVVLIVTVLVLMALIVFLVGRSFGFFQYMKKGEVVNVVAINGLDITIDNETDDALNLTDAYPEYDSDGLQNDPFTFTINNTSSKPIDYTLKLLNDSEKQAECVLEDEVTPCTLLPYEYIKYAYSINNGAYSEPANLTSDGTIYSETIGGKANTTISIKLWIDSTAPNSIQGNAFFGKLVLSGTKSNKAIVTLNPNGGTISSTSILITPGTAIGDLPEPFKEEYTFKGWYLENTFDTKIESDYIITESIILYAKWGETNLLNLNRTRGYPSNTALDYKTKRTFDFDTYVVGLASNNYYAPSYVSNYSISENSVSVTSKCGYGVAFPIATDPSTTYTASFTTTNYSSLFYLFYQSDGTLISLGTVTNNGSFTTPANAAFTNILFYGGGPNCDAAPTNTVFSNIVVQAQ